MGVLAQNIPIYFELFTKNCQIQLAGLIERHLDLDPTTDLQVLKSSYLHKSCLKYPQSKFKMNCIETFRCCCSLDIV